MLRPILIAVAVVVVAAALFIALKPDDSGNDSGGEVTTSAGTPAGTTGATGATGATESQPKPQKPKVPTVVFKGDKPVGGILGIEVDKGKQIRFKVKSDVADEVHVHGFDISRDVAAGGTVSLSFPADITGIYEAEMEHHGVQVVELQVNP